MSHYKRDAASNRDALFGGAGAGRGGSTRNRPAAARPQQPRPSSASSASSGSRSTTARSALPTSTPTPGIGGGGGGDNVTPGPSAIFTNSARLARNAPVSLLTGQAKISKMAEAEDYRLKAKKAMTRGVFSKPDPVSAGNYYKRAADAYRSCGEVRLERLHRIASGDCQMGQDAHATAAGEYTRAAELAELTAEETIERKRKECHKLHLDASAAWNAMGERGRGAESAVKAAFGLVMGAPPRDRLDPTALKAVEEGVECFVGDPLNRKRDYRRTGASAYDGGDGSDAGAALELARQNIVTDSYAHETLFKACTELLRRKNYESALYAHGAGTATLEHEGYATVSLYRAYLSEAIITLAMGDVVAASNDFQRVHLQNTGYLSSRECAMEEDLIRAVEGMDGEALEAARSTSGPHRAAMANLDVALRELVGEIRVSGRVGGAKKAVATAKKAQTPPSMEPEETKGEISREELLRDTDAGFAEMGDIMNQMGLNDDDDNGDSSDDDIDLT